MQTSLAERNEILEFARRFVHEDRANLSGANRLLAWVEQSGEGKTGPVFGKQVTEDKDARMSALRQVWEDVKLTLAKSNYSFVPNSYDFLKSAKEYYAFLAQSSDK